MKYIASLILSFIFSVTTAQQLFKESFVYPENASLTLNGWTAHSGTGTNAIKTGAGLTYTGLAAGGNAASLITNGEDINRGISKEVTSGVFYVSFLINISNAQDAGDYFFHLGPKDLGSAFRARFFAKKNGTGFSIGLAKSATNPPNYSAAIYDFNKTYLIVLKYTFKTTTQPDDTVALFVNPSLETEPAQATVIGSAGDNADNIGTIALRQGSAASAPTLRVDEIKMGLTWSDILGIDNGTSLSLKNLPSNLTKTVNKTGSVVKIDLFGEKLEDKIEILAEDEKTFEVSKDEQTWSSSLVLSPVNGQLIESFSIRISDKLNTAQAGKQNLIVRYVTNKKILATNAIAYQITEVIDGFSKILAIKSLSDQVVVKISGRVTSAGEINNLLYVQDETAGIPVSGTFTNMKIGDSVQVTGKLGNISKQLIINSTEILKIGTTSNLLTPKSITIAQMAVNEGNLISVEAVKFTDLGFVFFPNTNYTLTDGKTNTVVRIWDGTDIDGRTKPQSAIKLTGVIGRFNDTYQIYPRQQADVPTSEIFSNPTANVGIDKTLDVVTWNVLWFGNTGNGPSEEALQLNNVKRTIDSLKADLYVLAEVSNTAAFDNLMTKLPNYKGVCSTAFSAGASANDAQRVCFVYKTADLTLVSTKILLKNAPSLNYYPDGFDRFWASGRLPFMGTFDVNISGAKTRVSVVGIHARANTGSDGATREKIYQQRKIDVEVLKDTLDKQYEKEAIILAGDYNDDLDENVVVGISTTASSYKKYVDDTQNWLPITRSLSDRNYRSYITESNVIDHLMVSNELKDIYLPNSETIALPFTYIPNYINTTSDHLPIMARFRLDAFLLSNENKTKSGIVFPNPTDGNFELELDDNLALKESNFVIINQTGNTIFEVNGSWSNVRERIYDELKSKPIGNYYLKVVSVGFSKVFRISLAK